MRRFPTSRWAWFKKDRLSQTLNSAGIGYQHLGDLLGGYRKGGYPAFTETLDFERGVRRLLELASGKRTAFMCAERLFSGCHRQLIAQRLLGLGVRVIHIVEGGKVFEAQPERHLFQETVDKQRGSRSPRGRGILDR